MLDTHESLSGSIVIPETVTFKDVDLPVTSIYDWSFEDRELITDITLPDTVNEICEGAFYYCFGLQSVNVPDGVTEISREAFFGCVKLDNVILPEGLQKIGESAFSYCESLTNINIPESVTDIGEAAFEGSIALTNIIIPENVKSIGLYAFNGCTSLLSIDVDKNNAYYLSKDGVLFDKDQTVLMQYPCGKGGDYPIPDGVVEINTYAFSWNKLLTGVTIPDSMKKIGSAAFTGCTAVSYINIPANVDHIGEGAFSECTALASYTVDEGNAYFKDVDGVLFSKDGADLIAYPNKRADEYIIPDTVTKICSEAFCGCEDLKKLTVPESVTVLGDFAFDFCNSLEYNEYGGACYLGCDTNKYVVLVNVPDNELESRVDKHEILKERQYTGQRAVHRQLCVLQLQKSYRDQYRQKRMQYR